MGLSSSSDEWCKHSDRAIQGFPWARKIVDDILVWATSIPELLERVRSVAKRCQQFNIVLSKSKLEVGTEIPFAGCVVSETGVKPDPNRIKALSEFPRPKDITGVRSFLGLANQLAFFVPDFAHQTVALRGLTGKNASFIWLDQHQAEFDSVKKILTSEMVVTHYNPDLPVTLLTDASRLHGLGFALGHFIGDKFKLVTCGSKALTPTQQRYSTVELECLAIHFGISKCGYYLKGHPGFTVATDHKPLEGVFNKDIFELPNPRLQRIREKLTSYRFRVTWVPGKSHYIADALSRAPLFAPQEDEDLDIDSARSCLTATKGDSLRLILDNINSDYCDLRNDVLQGKTTCSYSNQLKSLMPQLSVDGELVYLDARRIVLPTPAVAKVLPLLHAGHAGMTKTYEYAKALYYWPGMVNDIRQAVRSCETCRKHQPSQCHNPRVSEPPSVYKGPPMSHVGLDLFAFAGQSFLICVDQWSGYPVYQRLQTLTTRAVTKILENWFNTLGWPVSIRTDGGPQFQSEFRQFCSENNIIHELSSPYNPRANGLAESGVKNVKLIIKKCKDTKVDPQKELYAWRNIPRATGFSPAQLLFGRRQFTNLPTSQKHYHLIDFDQAARVKDKLFYGDEARYNRNKKDHGELFTGESVFLQNPKSKLWTEKGEICEIRPDKQSYLISLDGHEVIRHRSMIKKAFSEPDMSSDHQSGANKQPVKSQACVVPVMKRITTGKIVDNTGMISLPNRKITTRIGTSTKVPQASASSRSSGRALQAGWVLSSSSRPPSASSSSCAGAGATPTGKGHPGMSSSCPPSRPGTPRLIVPSLLKAGEPPTVRPFPRQSPPSPPPLRRSHRSPRCPPRFQATPFRRPSSPPPLSTSVGPSALLRTTRTLGGFDLPWGGRPIPSQSVSPGPDPFPPLSRGPRPSSPPLRPRSGRQESRNLNRSPESSTEGPLPVGWSSLMGLPAHLRHRALRGRVPDAPLWSPKRRLLLRAALESRQKKKKPSEKQEALKRVFLRPKSSIATYNGSGHGPPGSVQNLKVHF